MTVVFQSQLPLGGLPVQLMLIGNKEYADVAFVKVSPFKEEIYDCAEDGSIRAVFFADDFCFVAENDEYFQYNTRYDYKSIPLMLKWLQAQNLRQPL